jgi:fumarate reductase flavoprotein subunit
MTEFARVGVEPAERARFDFDTEVVVVGAGAAGLVASLAAREQGAEVVVLERDASPSGSTALSSGLVPAAGTRLQAEAGVKDSPDWLAEDIRLKAHGEVDDEVVNSLSACIGPTLDWLMDRHAVAFTLIDGFSYPGHRVRRMHGPAQRSGRYLVSDLERASKAAGAELLTSARVDTLFVEGDQIKGVRVMRPDGSHEDVGCKALVLACCGFAGNRELLSRYLPDMLEAAFLGHAGNEGHAVRWGEILGAQLSDMQSFQGHGSVAIPHQIGISWALMMSGGYQVNRLGERFANEHRGYSEQARDVLKQSQAIAFDIFDERCHRVGMAFDHYREAEKAGALVTRPTLEGLAEALGLPVESMLKTHQRVARYASGELADPFGRNFKTQPLLEAPFYGIRITGGLYHTQGGLDVDARGRVRRPGGALFPNLWATGGAARGISGPADWGYLAGNGLMTAIGLGRLAGIDAAQAALAR